MYLGGSQTGNEEKELNEVKKDFINNQMTLFVLIKIRVPRKKEYENDYESLRFNYKRTISKALEEVGEVKHCVVIT